MPEYKVDITGPDGKITTLTVTTPGNGSKSAASVASVAAAAVNTSAAIPVATTEQVVAPVASTSSTPAHVSTAQLSVATNNTIASPQTAAQPVADKTLVKPKGKPRRQQSIPITEQPSSEQQTVSSESQPQTSTGGSHKRRKHNMTRKQRTLRKALRKQSTLRK